MAYILLLEIIIFIFHFIPGRSKGVGTVNNAMPASAAVDAISRHILLFSPDHCLMLPLV